MSRRRTPVLVLLAALALVAAAPAAHAATYWVIVTNLTSGQPMSPPVVISHDRDMHLWEPGAPSSPEVWKIAENGDSSALLDLLPTLPQVTDFGIADGGPIPPGQTKAVRIEADYPKDRITVLGMLGSTNDSFYGLDAVELPFQRMEGTYWAIGYDAGSERNDESCDHVPGPPCHGSKERLTDGAEGYVYVGHGIQGVGDLTPNQDWRNPVARILIQVER